MSLYLSKTLLNGRQTDYKPDHATSFSPGMLSQMKQELPLVVKKGSLSHFDSVGALKEIPKVLYSPLLDKPHPTLNHIYFNETLIVIIAFFVSLAFCNKLFSSGQMFAEFK